MKIAVVANGPSATAFRGREDYDKIVATPNATPADVRVILDVEAMDLKRDAGSTIYTNAAVLKLFRLRNPGADLANQAVELHPGDDGLPWLNWTGPLALYVAAKLAGDGGIVDAYGFDMNHADVLRAKREREAVDAIVARFPAVKFNLTPAK